MRLSRYLVLVFLLCPIFAYGQGMQVKDVANKLVNGVYVPAIGASVTVCTSAGSGTPCTPLATIYTDKALTQTSANPIIIGTSSNSDTLGNFNFYVSPSVYVATLTGSGLTSRSTTYQVACPTDGNCAFTGNNTFKNLNAIRFADQFAGADCGAKINAADTDLGATAGEIWVNQNCGTTWTTAVIVNATHIVRIVQGGQYNISAMITLAGTGSGMTCAPTFSSGGGVTVNGPCYLKESNAANLPAIIKYTGSLNFISGLTVDGNKANQTCPSPPCYVVWVFRALRGDVSFAQLQQGFTRNLQVESSGPFGNESAAFEMFKSQSVFATGSAIQVLNTADTSFTDVQAGQSSIGLELIDASTARIMKGDYGGNSLNGIKATCVTAADGGGGIHIIGNQIGTNLQHQLLLNAWTGSAQCNALQNNIIADNQFVTPSAANGGTANTYDAILIQNSGGNSVTGNVINAVNGGVSYKTAIEFQQPSVTEGTDVVIANNLQGWATSALITVASTYALGNTNANSVMTSGSLTLASTLTLGGNAINGINGLTPNTAGVGDIGTTALPFPNLWLGTAATNNFKLQPAATGQATTISLLDPKAATATVSWQGGIPCTNGELALSAGWGTTATVTAVVGLGWSCEWTVTSSGTGQGANPTITDTLVLPVLSASIACEMRMVGGTGTSTLIDQTTLSATAPIFTFGGTPVAASTYKVYRRC